MTNATPDFIANLDYKDFDNKDLEDIKFSVDQKKFENKKMSTISDNNIQDFKIEYMSFINKLRAEQDKLKRDLDNISNI